jgi:DNA invertase Pin-like site-specific DNA recombinase
MLSKITFEHLSRWAYIYIRQSWLDQVRHHLESQRLQYQLADRAKELGWPSPVVIDDDLGRSGSGRTIRPGFSRLLTAVCEGIVGAIFCLEASRLARNNREWYQLIDYCAMFNTLLIDLDGVYDPRNVSDRVFLGMKGTMSEYEVSMFRLRAQTAILEKAKRGALYIGEHAGYVYTPEERYELDPDQRVQEIIALIFKKFREFGTANQVVLWFRDHGFEVPYRTRRRRTIEAIWKLPTHSTITKILKNPFYAGAYVYGRKQTRVTLVDGQPLKTGSHELPMDQWKVLIHHHHPAYVSWEEYLAIRQRLPQNASRHPLHGSGAPKRGPALLVGLLRCQKCSRKFQVRYKGAHSNLPRYICVGQARSGRPGRCLEFFGTQLEEWIATEVLRVVEPAAIAVAEEVERQHHEQQREKETVVVKMLAQAEYEAQHRYEQYNLVDPKNRLVAQNLESCWNEALQQVQALRQQLDQMRQTYQPLSPQQRQALYQLVADLPRVWQHPAADVRIKKRILQTLITEIMVDLTPDDHWVFSIHWAGGKHTQYRLKRRQRGERPNHLPAETEAIIRGLAEVTTDQEIARILNRLKINTASGKNWIAARIATFRRQHDIPVFNPAEYAAKGFVNLTEAAKILDIYPMAVYRLIKANVVKARQVVSYGPWSIDKEQLQEPAVQRALAALKKGAHLPLTNNPNQLSFE